MAKLCTCFLRGERFFRTSRIKKERSCSGGMLEFPPPSPNMSRRVKDNNKNTTSTSRLRHYAGTSVAQLVDLTIFHIPGLDVKVSPGVVAIQM